MGLDGEARNFESPIAANTIDFPLPVDLFSAFMKDRLTPPTAAAPALALAPMPKIETWTT